MGGSGCKASNIFRRQGGNNMQRKWKRRWRRALSITIAPAVVAATLIFSVYNPVLANPSGATVTSGSGSIANNGATTTITQTSDKLAINWQSFNIGKGETVNFLQPGTNSVALNRVVGSSGSAIYGALNANGKVFLINPNGILFARGSQVNVGGLVASTLQLTDSDFLAGRYSFAGTGTGSVSNEGTIHVADGGYVALLGNKASNEGVILANKGTVAMAAGKETTLDFTGDGLINLTVSKEAINAQVSNSNLIQADGGLVVMTAKAAGALTGAVVNNSGIIRAQGLAERNGKIVLDGGSSGVVSVSGMLDASGKTSGLKGGTVKVLGDNVALTSGSTIAVSGDAGGGTVLVGGAYHGGSSERAATNTTVEAGAAIAADAITSGNGGQVVVWANDTTRFAGSITAKGGVNGGDGGQVETSGKQMLKVADTARVNTLALKGKTGNWLLDPKDFTVAVSGGDMTGTTLSTNLGSSNMTISSGDGTVSGSGNVTINDAVTWSADTTLTINADNNININAPVTIGGANAGLTMNYGGDYNIRTKASYSGAVLDTNGKLVPKQDTSGGVYGSVTFTNSGNTNGLSINGQTYTLIHSMSDLDQIDGYNAAAGSGTAISAGGKYALAQDLDADGTTYITSLLGSGTSTVFSGTFTGLGHTISNLKVSANSAVNAAGLFGYSSGTIRDIGVSGGNITHAAEYTGGLVGNNTGSIANSYFSGDVEGNSNVGGLAGSSIGGSISSSFSSGTVKSTGIGDRNVVGGLVGSSYAGTISDSNSASSVTSIYGSETSGYQNNYVAGGLVGAVWNGGAVSNSYSTGTISGSSTVGGLAGVNYATITNSYSEGAVNATSNDVGGLVGVNYGAISGSHSTSKVTATQTNNVEAGNTSNDIGGLVGTNNTDGTHTGSITNSYSTGDVQGTGWVGGLVGYNNTNASITDSYSTGRADGYYSVGGLAGTNAGGSITNSHSEGAVTGANRIGGLVGKNSGAITNSDSSSTVTRSGSIAVTNSSEGLAVGGLVGYNTGTVSDSFSSGSIESNDTGVTNYTGNTLSSYAGGLVGNNQGVISNSHSTGPVQYVSNDASSITYYYTGGLVGINQALTGNSQTGIITNSYASGNVTVNETGTFNHINHIGGLAGGNYGGSITGSSYRLGRVYSTVGGANVYMGGLVGYQRTGNITNSYNTGSTVEQAASNVFTSYVGGLVGFNFAGTVTGSFNESAVVNGGGTSGGSNYIGGLVGHNYGAIQSSYNIGTVTNASNSTYNSVGGVAGKNYYGDSGLPGYSNTGGSIQDSYNQGVVSNIGATNSYNYLGGLVGEMQGEGGSIQNSRNKGNLLNTGNNGAYSYTGGLIGYANRGSIKTSYNTGNVTSGGSGLFSFVGGLAGYNLSSAIQTSYNTGNVTSGSTGDSNYAGGLIGKNNAGSLLNTYNQGTVMNSGTNTNNTYTGGLVAFNSGTVGGGSITNSYNAGLVSGKGYAGGLVGDNTAGGSISNSYWDVENSGMLVGVGNGPTTGATGKTTAQMMTNNSFYVNSGWNFNSIWGMIDGVSYPYFTWNYATAPQVVSGKLQNYIYTPGGAVSTVTLAVNGTVKDRIGSGANGFYYFLEPNGTIGSGDAVVTYSQNYGSGANAVHLASGVNPSITGLDLSDMTVSVTGGIAGATLNLADVLTTAKGDLTDNILYTVDDTTGAVAVTGSLTAQTPSNLWLNKKLTVRDNLFLTVASEGGLLTIDAPVTRRYSSHTFGLTADRMAINALVDQGQTNAEWAKIAPYTSGWGIVFGSTTDTASKSLEISASEYAKLGIVTGSDGATSRNIQYGDTNTGAIQITDYMVNNSADNQYRSSIRLVNSSSITESGAGALEADRLVVLSDGDITLNGLNKANYFAAVSNNHDIKFHDALLDGESLYIYPVGSYGGINAGTGNLTLTIDGNGSVVNMGTSITANGLELIGPSSRFWLYGSPEAALTINTLAGNVGTAAIGAKNSFSIGTVGNTVGLTSNGVTTADGVKRALGLESGGTITQTAAINAKDLYLGEGAFALTNANNHVETITTYSYTNDNNTSTVDVNYYDKGDILVNTAYENFYASGNVKLQGKSIRIPDGNAENNGMGIVGGGDITLLADKDITVGSSITSMGGNILVAAGEKFINNTASNTGLVANTGRYMVYSANPTDTVEGMTGYNKHYNQAYAGGTTPDYAAGGNWFLYSIAPIISVTPGSQSVTYGTAPGSFTSAFTGLLDGDTAATAGISGTAAFSIDGPLSDSGNYTIGSHEVTYSGGLSSSLGYTFQNNVASVNELTVTPNTIPTEINEQVETAVKHSENKANIPPRQPGGSATGTNNSSVPVEIVQTGINQSGITPMTPAMQPQAAVQQMPVAVQIIMSGSQMSSYNVTVSGQSLTVTLAEANLAGTSESGTTNLAVLAVKTGESAQSAGYYVATGGNGGLTLAPSAISSRDLPAEPGESAAATTFSLLAAGGNEAKFQVLYDNGALSIRPGNEAAENLLQIRDSSKLVIATGILTAAKNLGVSVQEVAAVYLH
jgi:filamentous hemagglutinin family protein